MKTDNSLQALLRERRQPLFFDEQAQCLHIIDQTALPHRFVTLQLETLDAVCHAIMSMQVRGAPLIGITAAFGMFFALREHPDSVAESSRRLLQTRPTAVNLQWALQRSQAGVESLPPSARAAAALLVAQELMAEDAASCSAIGDYGLTLLEQIWLRKRSENPAAIVNILTHCNAGWLATAAWGTALAPVYKAHQRGIPVHVWVDETRPRNQGAALTAWELGQQGVPHTVIVDNAGGHLMQHGQVDICLVGSDRTTAQGDVCNKIGTYLKALAAFDNKIPFYAALPVATIDFTLQDGLLEIPIEERQAQEVTHIQGLDAQGQVQTVQVTPAGSAVSNMGFDVTPARLLTGLITERGIVDASVVGLRKLQPAVR